MWLFSYDAWNAKSICTRENRLMVRFLVCVLLLIHVDTFGLMGEDGNKSPRQRQFEFEYGGSIQGVPAGATVRVWMPIPPSNVDQQITTIDEQLPGASQTTKDPKYGNAIRFFETQSPENGEIRWNRKYRVVRHETRSLNESRKREALSAQSRELFLSPTARVPVHGKPDQLLRGVELPSDPLEVGRVLYGLVDAHVSYDKSRPGYGRGDSNWVCDSRFGNCTDFHSLFISLARGRELPARFEIGFPLPEKRGQGKVSGYHCWGWFYVEGQGWVPVDISEADKHPELKDYYFGNLSADRIAFSTGRDIPLNPPQADEAPNYFVYPHIEVAGKIWPKDSTTLRFRFRDIE